MGQTLAPGQQAAMTTGILEKPKRQPAQLGPRQTILVVDDDEVLADVLSRRLTQQGFEVRTADSGRDGLALARTEQPDLIVLDLRLPDMDGFAICEQLADSAETCNIPVIILSGMERPDIIRRSRSAGCCYFVRKPYDPNALLVLIRQAIRESTEWDWGAGPTTSKSDRNA
ncbi:MAG: response regulator [Pirellulales bacterium]|nr:response regulator [Pirellulales bacterium]